MADKERKDVKYKKLRIYRFKCFNRLRLIENRFTKISVIRDWLISKRKVGTECSKNEAIGVCKKDVVDRGKMK